MLDDLRWLSRYQFLHDLWGNRDRLIVDPVLEAVAHGRDIGRPTLPPALRELALEVVLSPTDGRRVWMMETIPARAIPGGQAHRHPVSLRFDAGDLRSVERADWRTALVDLSPMLERDGDRGAFSIAPRYASFLRTLENRARSGHSVVLAARAEGLNYEQFSELLSAYISDAQIFGIGAPKMASVFQFGDEDAVDDTDEAEDISVEFDSSLADVEPDIGGFVAVVSNQRLGGNMALLELPSLGIPDSVSATVNLDLGDGENSDEPATDSLRAQDQNEAPTHRVVTVLGETSSYIRQVDDEDELPHIDDDEDEDGDEDGEDEDGEEEDAQSKRLRQRIDQALAVQQTLEWETQELSARLQSALGGPVGEQQAEIARLRRRLKLAGVEDDGSPGVEDDGGQPEVTDAEDAVDEPGSRAGQDPGSAGVGPRLDSRVEPELLRRTAQCANRIVRSGISRGASVREAQEVRRLLRTASNRRNRPNRGS